MLLPFLGGGGGTQLYWCTLHAGTLVSKIPPKTIYIVFKKTPLFNAPQFKVFYRGFIFFRRGKKYTRGVINFWKDKWLATIPQNSWWSKCRESTGFHFNTILYKICIKYIDVGGSSHFVANKKGLQFYWCQIFANLVPLFQRKWQSPKNYVDFDAQLHWTWNGDIKILVSQALVNLPVYIE